MIHRIALSAAVLLALTPAVSKALTITVVNEAHVSNGLLMREEAGLRDQAKQLRRYWHTPRIEFGQGGWRIYLVPGRVVADCGNVDKQSGCHYWDAANNPIAYVGIGGSRQDWQDTFSHELVEMLVDPHGDRYIAGQLVEIADPIVGFDYRLDGVWVTDFALPAYFTAAERGQLDFMNILAQTCMYPLKATGC